MTKAERADIGRPSRLPWRVRRAVSLEARLAVWRGEPVLTSSREGQITTTERDRYFTERDVAIASLKSYTVQATAQTVVRVLQLKQDLVDLRRAATTRPGQDGHSETGRRGNEIHTAPEVVEARRRREREAREREVTATAAAAAARITAARAEASRLVAELTVARNVYLRLIAALDRDARLRRDTFDTVLVRGRTESTVLGLRLSDEVRPIPDELADLELPDVDFLKEAPEALPSQPGGAVAP